MLADKLELMKAFGYDYKRLLDGEKGLIQEYYSSFEEDHICIPFEFTIERTLVKIIEKIKLNEFNRGLEAGRRESALMSNLRV